MSALAEFNELKAEAKSYGIDVKGLKKVDLLPLVEAERAKRKAEREAPCGKCGQPNDKGHDCFDDIDPETEGDHLTEDTIEEIDIEKVAAEIGATPSDLTNREGWLLRLVYALEPMMRQVGAVYDPAKVRVSVGFGPRRKALGVCFPTHATNAGLSYVFISPVEDDALKIAATVVHELIHVSDDCASGHKNHFAKCARALGLEGKLTATVAGEGLNHALADILKDLGEYPHTKLNLSGVKKQGTRMKLVECPADGFKFRTTAKWIDTFDKFTCPCGETMTVDGEDPNGEGDDE